MAIIVAFMVRQRLVSMWPHLLKALSRFFCIYKKDGLLIYANHLKVVKSLMTLGTSPWHA